MVFSIHATNESTSFCGGWGLPGGGIRCPRSLRSAFSPDLRIIRGGLEIQTVEREAADFQSGVVAADTVAVQYRAMWIRGAFVRSACGCLPCSPVLQNRQGSDYDHLSSARVNETLHMLKSIAYSMIWGRILPIRALPFYHKKRKW